MLMLKGLYMSLPECGHTYGIKALNDYNIYIKLKNYFNQHRLEFKWFLQGDSLAETINDHSWLFIEFLGMGLNDDTALMFCENIAKEINCKLNIL